ncbi:TnsD family Tn7-like transposition protein [Paenibacillus sp. WC2504]|uniref:TnsD family Tn7-like transposition protein n=1 Tax=Paenibacillus sp. WC2504 TaxID=3461403 RepID=UPI0040465EA7
MHEINFFSIFPEEDYRSIIARYNKYSSHSTLNKTNKELFNKNSARIGLVPNNLNWLISKARDSYKEQIEKMPYNNTLLPLIISFLNNSQLEKLKKYMFSGYAINPVATLLKKFISNEIRYCPKCISEDYKNIGEAYIHRLHQLNSINICYIHFVPLVLSIDFTNSDDNGKEKNHFSIEYINFEKNLMEDIVYLLKNPANSEIIYNTFITVLGSKGYISRKGEIYKKELILDYMKSTSRIFLDKFNLELHLRKDQIFILFSKPHFTRNMFLYILLMRYLCSSSKNFLENNYDYFTEIPFGIGPWKCINPVCEYQNENIITRISRVPSTRIKLNKFYAEFQCPKCFYTYIKINEKSNRTETRYVGQKWISCLIKMYKEGNSVKNIAKDLKTSSVVVNKYLKIINDHIFGNIEMETKTCDELALIILDIKNKKKQNLKLRYRDFYRKELLLLINSLLDEEKTRVNVRKLNNKLYVWLIANDREWLDQVLPSRQYSQKPVFLDLDTEN